LISHIINPLQDLGILSEPMHPGATKWEGWLRIPDRNGEGMTWESRPNRREGLANKTGTFIRVDFNYAPKGSKGAALLALTGDRDFFSDIQSRAAKLGMYLNEYGLWKWDSTDSSSMDRGEWTFIEGRDEEAILKEIGIEYVEPEKRNFSFLKPGRVPRRAVKQALDL